MSVPTRACRPDHEVTLEEIEAAMDTMALVMAEAPDGGVTYLPIWNRLEAARHERVTNGAGLAAAPIRTAKIRASENK